MIVRAGKEGLEFHLVHFSLDLEELLVRFFEEFVIVLLLGEFETNLRVFELGDHCFEWIDLRFDQFVAGDERLSGFLVIPESVYVHLVLKGHSLRHLGVVVKESHGLLRSAPRVPQRSRHGVRNA